MINIGIDPGVHTGVAVSIGGVYVCLKTVNLFDAIKIIDEYVVLAGKNEYAIMIYIENPNINKPIFIKRGANARAYMRIAQNVGSNKRDAQLIIQYCTDHKIPCTPVAPVKGPYHKPTAKLFYQLTGCKGKTSQHARDAAMLIIGR